ncbi:hypothetical protein F5879DRAFT_926423 [Lentinula edodes]|uniref:uncharacterized protein n=1 Tax=Lentinula edodes TaxID=5353 RepID=UPI001E8DDC01|nr:uncharacterized protein C8R40DRAFT_1069266 [Lentinula edodes]KAH7875676.1 hypothetical protein C8R40DRAFT_1069266 [Lentinula edodes]KAJ3899196.1 hypothetical protein F5879DRAFT_926423 [Lentinula edodes]
MLPKLLPKLLLAFFLLSTFAGTIASPLAARGFDGRRINTQQIALQVKLFLSLERLAKPQLGENRPWQGTGINTWPQRSSRRTGLVIARVKFASNTEKEEVLQYLGKLEATSNLLYLIKVLREMAAMAREKKKITGFEWKNQLEWQQQYWKMIEMFEDGLGGKVDGNEKKIYQDLLMKRQEKAKEMEAKKSGES